GWIERYRKITPLLRRKRLEIARNDRRSIGSIKRFDTCPLETREIREGRGQHLRKPPTEIAKRRARRRMQEHVASRMFAKLVRAQRNLHRRKIFLQRVVKTLEVHPRIHIETIRAANPRKRTFERLVVRHELEEVRLELVQLHAFAASAQSSCHV